MNPVESRPIVIKKEPTDVDSVSEDDAAGSHGNGQNNANHGDSSTSATSEPIRYVSRRGRPPGGGYSMKTQAHYINFGSASSLATPQDYAHQASSSLSPQELLKSASTDSIDIRRFGFQGFDTDKSTFRCDGCDIVFSSRDTYAMHMLLRAKNESCVALPTSAISSNPENPTPREKFERELRQQAMIAALRDQANSIALRDQACVMSKAAIPPTILPKAKNSSESSSNLTHSPGSSKDDGSIFNNSSENGASFNSLFSLDTYGLYVDTRQYRRFLAEYGLRASSTGSLAAMMKQLSCGVCGELFSNKDALAMHMMFHTREEEAEAKPNVMWKHTALAASDKKEQPFRNTPREETDAKMGAVLGKRKDFALKGDRQLTAERVAELKRMAIESSLQSSKWASVPHNKCIPRPKSVSEDTVVSSTAQTRPLSADDAANFILAPSSSGLQTSKNTVFFSSAGNSQFPNFDISCRKRLFSAPDKDAAFDYKQKHLRSPKRKQDCGSSDLYGLFSQYPSPEVSRSTKAVHADRKVYDDHVSSASGPQDMEESNDRYVTSPNNHGHTQGSADGQAKTRGSPFLDAIMSNDAVLVPLENDRIPEGEITMPLGEDNNSGNISALDFSMGSRKRRSSFSTYRSYATSGSHDGTAVEEPSPNAPSLLLNSSTPESESLRRRFYSHLISRRPTTLSTFSDPRPSDSSETTIVPTTTTSTTISTASSSPPVYKATGNRSLDSRATDTPSRDVMRNSPSRGSEARYCPHCEILFLDVTLFHLHMGLHNVNNPWQCNTCGLVCAGRLEFNTHVLHY